jgi:hypothetical protein
VNTPRERCWEDPGWRRYSWCPPCQERWGAGWMAQPGVQDCPWGEGPVLAYIGGSSYGHDARAELRPWPILEGAQGGVHSHG